MKFKIKVGAVISKGNKFLILKRSPKDEYCPGWWDIPCGDLEIGETVYHGLKREVREETGLRVRPSSIFYIWEQRFKDTYIIGLIWVIKIKKGIVKLSVEHTDYVWLKKAELAKLRLTYGSKEVLLGKNCLYD